MARLSPDPLRGAYQGAADSWAQDASLAYVPLARHLLAQLEGRLPGPSALDAGAGTGAAGDLLRELGATVVSVDLEPDMLRHRLLERGHVLVGDVARLPLRSGLFDVVVAGFVLNHVADHVAALRELGRVTRPGGVLLASVFGNERSALKEVVDDRLLAFGWSPPEWYTAVRERADQVGTVERFEARARSAGLAATVRSRAVDVGLDTPEQVVRYRLAMAQNRGFVAGLSDDVRQALVSEAVAAVAATHEPFRPVVLELLAKVG
jgi:demethylmenaquinone methyltransferase/2-methoxy-6-polyprenyl-1,4-benzoquinol methylase